jgi:predicted glutamine amidotransferase
MSIHFIESKLMVFEVDVLPVFLLILVAFRMWGLNWAFCHNGHVPLFVDHPDTWLEVSEEPDKPSSGADEDRRRFYFPVGTTDSEATFCAILNSLRCEFHDHMPSLPVLYNRLQSLCKRIVDYDPPGTILNFLLACGPHVLWVYSWPGQRPGSTVWNGLHYTVRNKSTKLSDDDYSFKVSMKRNNGVKQASTQSGGSNNSCCIVATKPLTSDEEWVELQPGELVVLDNGLPHVSPRELFKLEFNGHGLFDETSFLGPGGGTSSPPLKPPRLEEDLRVFELQVDFFAMGGI